MSVRPVKSAPPCAVAVRAPVPAPAPAPTDVGDVVVLRDGELWSAKPLSGALHVRCVSGYVWLTQEL